MMPTLLAAANHSFRNNAEYRPFQFHPVLGFIEAVVAVRDIPRGSEVRVFLKGNLHCNAHVGFLRLWIQSIRISSNWNFSWRS